MTIRVSWFVFFFVAALSGFAQDIPGSVYSAYGLGDLRERSSAYTRSMGYTSIAVRGDYNLNMTNPAALTSITAPITSYFEIGAYYSTTYASTTAASKKDKFGGLAGINYWFRISKRWASVIGISPLSDLSYKVVTPRVFGTGAVLPVTSTGTGGINQFYFGNAFDIHKNLSLGVNLSYYLGNLKRSDHVPTSTVSTLFEVEKQQTARGGNIDFGIQYTLNLKKTKIIFGAIYDPGAHLNGTQETAIVNPITFDTLQKTERKRITYKLPKTFGGGIGLKRNRSTLAFDLRYLGYTKARFDQTGIVYQDSYKFSGGYEYRGDYNSFSYLKTISFRAGGWYQNYPVIVQGAKLNTWGYTAGVAFPIQQIRASIGINYSFTQNGVTQNELVREQSRRVSLDIIFRDIWGVKRKFD